MKMIVEKVGGWSICKGGSGNGNHNTSDEGSTLVTWKKGFRLVMTSSLFDILW